MKKLSFSLYSFILVLFSLSLILLGIGSEFIYGLVTNFIGLSPDSGIADFIKNKLAEATFYGFLLVIGFISTYIIAIGIEKFIQEKITPIIDGHVDRLSKEVNEIGNTTNSLLRTKVLEGIVNASEPREVRERLKEFHAKAFGEHCLYDHSLYSAVQNKLNKFYCPEVPHRSEYNQTVTVKDNGDDSIVWHEVCHYKLHSIDHDKNYGSVSREGIEYKIKYSTSAEMKNIGSKSSPYKLSLIVEGITLFDSEKHLVLNNGSVTKSVDVAHSDDIKIKMSGGFLDIILEFDYIIEKPWICIEIKETSTILDDYFISSRGEPTCGSNISINLPEGWTFDLIKFGHSSDWTIHQHPEHVMSAWTKEWLLPGITFFCKWRKSKSQELNLDIDR